MHAADPERPAQNGLLNPVELKFSTTHVGPPQTDKVWLL